MGADLLDMGLFTRKPSIYCVVRIQSLLMT
jgi:hypothetical protein